MSPLNLDEEIVGMRFVDESTNSNEEHQTDSATLECPVDSSQETASLGLDQDKEALLEQLSKVAEQGSAAHLAIGDLLASSAKRWSKIYEEAAARTGLSVGRLRNLVNVARSVPTSLRSDVVLPLDYYAAVARLKKKPEAQEELLAYAAEQRAGEKGLSIDAFREYVKAKHPPKNPKYKEKKFRVTFEPSAEVYEYLENKSLDWNLSVSLVVNALVEEAMHEERVP